MTTVNNCMVPISRHFRQFIFWLSKSNSLLSKYNAEQMICSAVFTVWKYCKYCNYCRYCKYCKYCKYWANKLLCWANMKLSKWFAQQLTSRIVWCPFKSILDSLFFCWTSKLLCWANTKLSKWLTQQSTSTLVWCPF